MSKEDVEKLVKEAEVNRHKDKEKKELVEARNIADSHIHQGEKLLKENAEKVKEEDKKLVEEKIESLKKILENPEATKAQIEEAAGPLNDALMKVGQAIYAATGTPDDGVKVKENVNDSSSSSEPSSEGPTVEAEVEDEEKK